MTDDCGSTDNPIIPMQVAVEIAQLRMDVKVLKDAHKHLRALVDGFAEHCCCEQTSATMLILHRAAMKHDPWSLHEASRDD